MTRGMVISKEIDERKMDYRGSKSNVRIVSISDIIASSRYIQDQYWSGMNADYYVCKRATSGCFFTAEGKGGFLPPFPSFSYC